MTRKTPTVCIVDDDEAVRDSFSVFLQAQGMRTRSFGSSEAFLASANQHKCHCLLLDLHLPGMDGIALLRHLAAQNGFIPTIVVTGRGDAQLAARALKAGAVAVFDKPVAWPALLDAIRRAVPAS